MREAKNQTIIAAVIAAVASLIVGFTAGRGVTETNQEVVVNLPDSQPVSLSLVAAGDRIERLSREVATAEARIETLRQTQASEQSGAEELRTLQSEVSMLQSELAACQTGPSSPGAAAPTGQPSPERVDTRTQAGFEISFFGCKRAGRETACTFEILNTQQDRTFRFSGYYHGSRMVAPGGVEYAPASVEVGNERDHAYVDRRIFSGVPTRAKMIFSGLPPDFSVVPVFLVVVSGGELQYKNVNIVEGG